MDAPKVVIIHGNSGGTGADQWIPWLAAQLASRGIETSHPTMPDNREAKMSVWLPHMERELGIDARTIVIGWSSGAVAAMRYAETRRIRGSVLVGACHTDLGDDLKKISGYYDAPWQWEKIRANQEWIVQFASADDPVIPVGEARHINAELGTEYYECPDRRHFGWPDPMPEFPELLAVLLAKLDLE